jgi:hypothetical protein
MGGQWQDFHNPKLLDNVTVNPVAFEAIVSLFQLARTSSSVLQWQTWSFTETERLPWVAGVMEQQRLGTPQGVAKEVTPGVFERIWTNGKAKLNCSAFADAVVGLPSSQK